MIPSTSPTNGSVSVSDMAFYTAINVTPGKGWNAVDEYYTGLRNDEWYQRISGSIFGGIYRRIGVPVGPYIDRRDVSQPPSEVLPSLDQGLPTCDASLWWTDCWACGVTKPNQHINGETNGLSRNTRWNNSNCVDDSRREEHPQPANHGPTITTAYTPSRWHYTG